MGGGEGRQRKRQTARGTKGKGEPIQPKGERERKRVREQNRGGEVRFTMYFTMLKLEGGRLCTGGGGDADLPEGGLQSTQH